jgi:hypothetical protein
MEYQGKNILYVDYRGQTASEEMIETLEEQIQVIRTSPTPVLVLSNFTESVVSIEYMTRLKAINQAVRDQKMPKNAVLGITGLKVVLLQSYIHFTGASNIQVFNTEDEALVWLVK